MEEQNYNATETKVAAFINAMKTEAGQLSADVDGDHQEIKNLLAFVLAELIVDLEDCGDESARVTMSDVKSLTAAHIMHIRTEEKLKNANNNTF